MTNYTIAYDIAAEGFQEWSSVYLSLGILTLSGVGYFIQKRRNKSVVTACVGMGFALLFLLVGVGMTFWDYNRLKTAQEQKQCSMVESEIAEYRTEIVTVRERRRTTRTWEQFKVGTVEFGYYKDVSAAGFHNAKCPAVPLRNGMKVRINYLREPVLGEGRTENRILRLEIANAE